MKVKDLIELLETFNPELEVLIVGQRDDDEFVETSLVKVDILEVEEKEMLAIIVDASDLEFEIEA